MIKIYENLWNVKMTNFKVIFIIFAMILNNPIACFKFKHTVTCNFFKPCKYLNLFGRRHSFYMRI